MKYQQLENLESGWKWKYLVKKHREGEAITRYIENSLAQEVIDQLLKLENEPVKVLAWIDEHMNPALDNRMKQTIRARRKRHFNSEHQHTRKKSIRSGVPGLATFGCAGASPRCHPVGNRRTADRRCRAQREVCHPDVIAETGSTGDPG